MRRPVMCDCGAGARPGLHAGVACGPGCVGLQRLHGAPVAVEGAVSVADEGADGRERGEDLEAYELEHLGDLLGGDRGVPHEGYLHDGHRDEDDEVADEQHDRA